MLCLTQAAFLFTIGGGVTNTSMLNRRQTDRQTDNMKERKTDIQLEKKDGQTTKNYRSNKWHTLISKDTRGFTSNTLLIRFPIMLSV